jgi:hypothetical protein
MAAPAPLVPVGTTGSGADPSAGAPAPSTPVEEQFFARTTLTPYSSPRTDTGVAGASDRAGKWITLGGMVALLLVAVAIAAFVMRPGSSAKAQTPVVLAPRPPTAGLPTSLDVIVRVQAESTRHTALQAVERSGSANTGELANEQPGYQWVAGDQPSADTHTVSVGQSAGAVTIAVAASNHDVCAFGQWSPATGAARYVTTAHQTTCAAVNAPSAGWSSEAGGAASDLPDDIG